MNLIGMVPGLEAPTNYRLRNGWDCRPDVSLLQRGTASRRMGIGYLKQFMGPVAWLAPLMIPIELISHFVRPLTLERPSLRQHVRGEQVTGVFLGLTYLMIPDHFYAAAHVCRRGSDLRVYAADHNLYRRRDVGGTLDGFLYARSSVSRQRPSAGPEPPPRRNFDRRKKQCVPNF